MSREYDDYDGRDLDRDEGLRLRGPFADLVERAEMETGIPCRCETDILANGSTITHFDQCPKHRDAEDDDDDGEGET